MPHPICEQLDPSPSWLEASCCEQSQTTHASSQVFHKAQSLVYALSFSTSMTCPSEFLLLLVCLQTTPSCTVSLFSPRPNGITVGPQASGEVGIWVGHVFPPWQVQPPPANKKTEEQQPKLHAPWGNTGDCLLLEVPGPNHPKKPQMGHSNQPHACLSK